MTLPVPLVCKYFLEHQRNRKSTKSRWLEKEALWWASERPFQDPPQVQNSADKSKSVRREEAGKPEVAFKSTREAF